tara:strand:+ start:2414 stop:3889 length:1476 start_codon:yes stop_codon:yes gene_type:complete
MATVSFSGPAAGSIVSPAYQKMTLATNYLDFTSSDVFGDGTNVAGWAQQYLPDLYEQEVDRYGNRTISGFLSMLSAEMPLQSDQVIWSEQGRLHLAYNGTCDTTNGAVTSITDIDGGSSAKHAVRKGATVVAVVENVVFKGYVSAGIETSETGLTILPYGAENIEDLAGISTGSQAIKFFVYGSEFAKGSDTMGNSVEPNFLTFNNRPMIIKDHFEINGSDTAQIGWIEVAGESGQGGYLWYLKSSGDTRVRFNDYMEMTMVEAEKVVTGSGTADSQLHDLGSSGVDGFNGSEGMFSAIENRGIVATNLVDNASDALADFDLLLAELDKQGAIEENMLYLNRTSNLIFDDMLGQINANYDGGTSFGVFENSSDMALNLGFSGFRRGSYDFYKTDWKYLNDASTRGLVGGIKGVIIPAGTSSVYDQQVGSNVRRPFLHVRYRAGQADDRKLKSWVTGSVGGPTSSSIDKMEIHYLSERCLVVQAANNFILLK